MKVKIILKISQIETNFANFPSYWNEFYAVLTECKQIFTSLKIKKIR